MFNSKIRGKSTNIRDIKNLKTINIDGRSFSRNKVNNYEKENEELKKKLSIQKQINDRLTKELNKSRRKSNGNITSPKINSKIVHNKSEKNKSTTQNNNNSGNSNKNDYNNNKSDKNNNTININNNDTNENTNAFEQFHEDEKENINLDSVNHNYSNDNNNIGSQAKSFFNSAINSLSNFGGIIKDQIQNAKDTVIDSLRGNDSNQKYGTNSGKNIEMQQKCSDDNFQNSKLNDNINIYKNENKINDEQQNKGEEKEEIIKPTLDSSNELGYN